METFQVKEYGEMGIAYDYVQDIHSRFRQELLTGFNFIQQYTKYNCRSHLVLPAEINS